jgi:tRNA-dihydrouridine synthase
LVEATVNAVKVPVTLKMRLGWDENSINAPELAKRAEDAGIAMVTVHGRTRCQFYEGTADWDAIHAVRDVVKIPLVANGDVSSREDAEELLRRSGADAVMVGRASYGQPWLAGLIAGSDFAPRSTIMAARRVFAIQESILAGIWIAMQSKHFLPQTRLKS